MSLSHKLLRISSGTLIMTSLLLAAIYYNHADDRSVQAATYSPRLTDANVVGPITPLAEQSGHPDRLQLNNQGVNLEIVDGYYNSETAQWTLTKDKVQFALPTDIPNNKFGNTLIYGHNRKGVFNNLYTLKKGDTATVSTRNGYVFTYTFNQTEIVEPTDTMIFAYEGKPRLTLQTCTGTFFQDRIFYYFSLSSVEKLTSS